ncbi:unnamed protein product [Brassica rapa subsp. trilocularis]
MKNRHQGINSPNQNRSIYHQSQSIFYFEISPRGEGIAMEKISLLAFIYIFLKLGRSINLYNQH